LDTSKINVQIKHYLNEYDEEGNLNTTETIYKIKKCTELDFNDTDFERLYWKNYEDDKMYCIDNPNNEFSLYGTSENRLAGKSYSSFTINVERCHNSTKVGAPKCSTKEEIYYWLQDKLFDVDMINKELELEPPFHSYVKQKHRILKQIPLS
jgi:hypothetical protein